MKKVLLALMLSICSSAFALPGKQEFIMSYPGEEIHFINDGAYIYVLVFAVGKEGRNGIEANNCIVAPMSGNSAKVGENTIVFYEDYAVINNKKRRFYLPNKTDLIFYRGICKKPN